MKPLVSVIIPCYNQAQFLRDAVGSVGAQSYPEWECIIVNDGSTDDTSAVARELSVAEPRIHVVEQTNKGLSGARNSGLRVARGQYIQFLDADDLIAPEKLLSQVTTLAATDKLALSYSDYRYCPENDVTATTTRDFFPPPRFTTGKPLWDIASRWETEFSIPVHCFLFDARFFREQGISFDETLPNHEDWDCWMRIFALEPVVSFVAEPFAIYRLRDNAMSRDLAQLDRGFDMALQKQLRIFKDNPEMQKRLSEKQFQMERVYGIRAPSSLPATSGGTLVTNKVKAIAFFLPQYHPIPENDSWWGKGFTEWTNTAKAKPLFKGHYQPHVPADLGFYDLRLPEAREAQAELARAYGIHGFCYYHYWFGGRHLLERPFNDVLRSGRPDFPFCLCWANENWTRRWDGHEKEILLAQHYSTEDDVAHIRWLINAFRDRRYITIDGKPLLLLYRVNLLPNPAETGRIWRDEVAKAGFPGLYLCTVIGTQETDLDPRLIGFDAAVEFQPKWGKLPPREKPPLGTLPDAILRRVLPKSAHEQYAPLGRAAYYFHHITSYSKVVETMMALPPPSYKLFPGVTPSWDNSARRSMDAVIFKDSDPATYGHWLKHAVRRSLSRFQGDEQLVFINAWNEWAEGNHLEPDLKWGHRYLEETRDALATASRRENL